MQSELDKLTEEQTSLKASKGRSARRSIERVSSRATQLRLEISELEKIGATPASLREWAKKPEEERPQPTTSRGIAQWFESQDALVKTFIVGFGFLGFLFACIIGLAAITPTPQTDSTSKYAREYETTAAQRDATEAARAPTSVTTPLRRPTSTKQVYTLEPSTRLTIIAMTGRTPETNTPEPTPTSTQKPTTTPTPIIYVVKAGDTLSAIAKQYGITVESLQEVNAISDPRRLQVGQELLIPQGETLARATVTRVKATPTPVPPAPTLTPQRTMYFCGYDPCRESGDYGQLVFETGINVWNNPEPERGGVHHQASHGDKVVVIEERRVYDGPGGLWYKLQGGGWANDLWLTDTLCTPDNLDEYSFTDCIMGKY